MAEEFDYQAEMNFWFKKADEAFEKFLNAAEVLDRNEMKLYKKQHHICFLRCRQAKSNLEASRG